MDTQCVLNVDSESESDQESHQSSRGERIATIFWNGFIFNLYLGENIIGRSKKCDVVLNDATVSDTHAEIVINDDEAIIRDIRSSNGTFVEQWPPGSNCFQRLKRNITMVLSSGCRVKFGVVDSIFEFKTLLTETQCLDTRVGEESESVRSNQAENTEVPEVEEPHSDVQDEKINGYSFDHDEARQIGKYNFIQKGIEKMHEVSSVIGNLSNGGELKSLNYSKLIDETQPTQVNFTSSLHLDVIETGEGDDDDATTAGSDGCDGNIDSVIPETVQAKMMPADRFGNVQEPSTSYANVYNILKPNTNTVVCNVSDDSDIEGPSAVVGEHILALFDEVRQEEFQPFDDISDDSDTEVVEEPGDVIHKNGTPIQIVNNLPSPVDQEDLGPIMPTDDVESKVHPPRLSRQFTAMSDLSDLALPAPAQSIPAMLVEESYIRPSSEHSLSTPSTLVEPSSVAPSTVGSHGFIENSILKQLSCDSVVDDLPHTALNMAERRQEVEDLQHQSFFIEADNGSDKSTPKHFGRQVAHRSDNSSHAEVISPLGLDILSKSVRSPAPLLEIPSTISLKVAEPHRETDEQRVATCDSATAKIGDADSTVSSGRRSAKTKKGKEIEANYTSSKATVILHDVIEKTTEAHKSIESRLIEPKSIDTLAVGESCTVIKRTRNTKEKVVVKITTEADCAQNSNDQVFVSSDTASPEKVKPKSSRLRKSEEIVSEAKKASPDDSKQTENTKVGDILDQNSKRRKVNESLNDKNAGSESSDLLNPAISPKISTRRRTNKDVKPPVNSSDYDKDVVASDAKIDGNRPHDIAAAEPRSKRGWDIEKDSISKSQEASVTEGVASLPPRDIAAAEPRSKRGRDIEKDSISKSQEASVTEGVASLPQKRARGSNSDNAVHVAPNRGNDGSVRIIFTGIEPLTELVSAIGGLVVDNPSTATHMVVQSGVLKRTPKLMIGINSGISYVVGENWLQDSAVLKKPIAIIGNLRKCKYIVRDLAKESQWVFNLADTLSLSRTYGSGVFTGLSIYATSQVCGVCAPKVEDMRAIVESAGGVWLDHLGSKTKSVYSHLIIIVSPPTSSDPTVSNKQTLVSKRTGKGEPRNRITLTNSELSALQASTNQRVGSTVGALKVYYPEMLFLACLRQKINLDADFEEYIIS